MEVCFPETLKGLLSKTSDPLYVQVFLKLVDLQAIRFPFESWTPKGPLFSAFDPKKCTKAEKRGPLGVQGGPPF